MENSARDLSNEALPKELGFRAVSPSGHDQLQCLDVLTKVERSFLQRVMPKMSSSLRPLVRQGSMLNEDLMADESKWRLADTNLDHLREGLADLRNSLIDRPTDKEVFKKKKMDRWNLRTSIGPSDAVRRIASIDLGLEEIMSCSMEGLTTSSVDYARICSWISAGDWCPNVQLLKLCSVDWAKDRGSKIKSLWIVTEVLYATKFTLNGRTRGQFNNVMAQDSMGADFSIEKGPYSVVLKAKQNKHFIVGYRAMRMEFRLDGTLRALEAPGDTSLHGDGPHRIILKQIEEDIFQVDEADVQPSSERYLERATTCMRKVQSMQTSLQLNFKLCEYLYHKLLTAIEIAGDCFPFDSIRFSESDHRTINCLGTFKLLFRLAKDVERFVQDCCSDRWIQHAMMYTNVSEYVSLMGYELDFCKSLLPMAKGEQVCAPSVHELLRCKKAEADIVESHALHDRDSLLEKLKALIQSSDPSTAKSCELATKLQARLEGILTVAPAMCIPGSVGLSSSTSFWQEDYGSLEQVENNKLGQGAAGTVYKLRWLGGLVAVKTFSGSDHPSFKNEVSMLARLSHPHIVPMFCYTIERRRCSIVMELMEEDLCHLMERRLLQPEALDCPFTIPEAVDLMLQVAEGVYYLHRNRVVHRDLKSSNILVNTAIYMGQEYVHAKVVDFGISKIKERSITYSNLTWNSGTTRWMAPELMPTQSQESMSQEVKEHYPFMCDIYSFGMVCFEILTGETPFQSTSDNRKVRRMVLDGERPKLPSQCPEALKALIQECWAEDASLRPKFDTICAKLRDLKFFLMTGAPVVQLPKELCTENARMALPIEHPAELLRCKLNDIGDDNVKVELLKVANFLASASSNACALVEEGIVDAITAIVQRLECLPFSEEIIASAEECYTLLPFEQLKTVEIELEKRSDTETILFTFRLHIMYTQAMRGSHQIALEYANKMIEVIQYAYGLMYDESNVQALRTKVEFLRQKEELVRQERAVILRLMGKYEEALKEFDRLLEFEEDYECLIQASYLKHLMEEKSGALEYACRAKKLEGDAQLDRPGKGAFILGFKALPDEYRQWLLSVDKNTEASSSFVYGKF